MAAYFRNTVYWGADKSLSRPGRKQAAPIKSVMGRGMDCFAWGRDRWWTLVNVVMTSKFHKMRGM